MFSDTITDYIEGVAAKYLSAVDTIHSRSTQHEIGGLPSVGFRNYLGTPAKGEINYFAAKLIYITDDEKNLFTIAEDNVSWYDCRDTRRSAEYRLYYKDSVVTKLFKEGDFLLIIKLKDGSLRLVACPPETTAESQLRFIFGLDQVGNRFSAGRLRSDNMLLPIRCLLEDLGVATKAKESDEHLWLDRLIENFGDSNFPSTAIFSKFSRDSIATDCLPVLDPDLTLLMWMDREEFLFRTYEKYFIQKRLKSGFGITDDDVDEFIAYSLSVQNRRKSRVGHAFESHLEVLFMENQLTFERGIGNGKATENNKRPDFIFPSFRDYHDLSFPIQKLTVLGAKTTLKDRWRQIQSEADRITVKHIVTLMPAISPGQAAEISAANVKLVVPEAIKTTYSERVQRKVQNLSDFILKIKQQQRDQH